MMTHEEWLASVAWREAMRAVLRRVPAHRRADAADEAMSIALGIVGGCCGPNGAFTREEGKP